MKVLRNIGIALLLLLVIGTVRYFAQEGTKTALESQQNHQYQPSHVAEQIKAGCLETAPGEDAICQCSADKISSEYTADEIRQYIGQDWFMEYLETTGYNCAIQYK